MAEAGANVWEIEKNERTAGKKEPAVGAKAGGTAVCNTYPQWPEHERQKNAKSLPGVLFFFRHVGARAFIFNGRCFLSRHALCFLACLLSIAPFF